MITALVVLAVWTGASVLAAGAWSCVAAAHKRRPRAAIAAPPPPDDPDATADDYEDVLRVGSVARATCDCHWMQPVHLVTPSLTTPVYGWTNEATR